MKFDESSPIVWLVQVALFTRAWIEIPYTSESFGGYRSPSLRGRGLKFLIHLCPAVRAVVALFTRAWIEITYHETSLSSRYCRPLYEGVD